MHFIREAQVSSRMSCSRVSSGIFQNLARIWSRVPNTRCCRMWGRGSHRTARPPLPPPWLARAPPGEVPESTYLKESGAGSSPASHNLLLAHVFFEIHNLIYHLHGALVPLLSSEESTT